MNDTADIPALLRHLADIARGNVVDRGERWAAALEAEAAASLLEELLPCVDEGARALQELADGHHGPADQQLVSSVLIERLRQLVSANRGVSE